MSRETTAVIFAGAAQTRFDSVRRVSLHRFEGESSNLHEHWHHEMDNIFKGQLGFMFAKYLLSKGVKTYLVQRKDSVFEHLEGLAEPVSYYKTFDELALILASILPRVKPDMVFMTSAPPDYAPVAIDGKMSSDCDEITITYKKTPKLIDSIRNMVGPECFIAGSKLLVGASDETMKLAAEKQIERAKSNACIGNDLTKIKPETGDHPFQVFFAGGEVKHFTGKKSDTSAAVIDDILKRVRV